MNAEQLNYLRYEDGPVLSYLDAAAKLRAGGRLAADVVGLGVNANHAYEGTPEERCEHMARLFEAAEGRSK